MLLKG